MTKRVAESIDALHRELNERMRGVPIGYSDGMRTVPVAYHVEATSLVDAEEFIARDRIAATALRNARNREAVAPHASASDRNACFNRLVNAQRTDDGIGTSFMTPSERALGSYEWGKRLRDLVEAGKRRERERECNRVLCDPQWED